jgi:hypothetical protein
LASAIEELQGANPTLSFNGALHQVYSRFPITGFWSTFIRGRKEALLKFWGSRFFSDFISYFTIPKILISLSIFLVSFAMYDQLIPVFKYLYCILLVVGLYFGFKNKYLRKFWHVLFLVEKDILNEYFGQEIGKQDKSYLIVETFLNRMKWVYIFIMMLWYFYFKSPELLEVSIEFKVMTASLFVVTIILINGLFVEMPKMLSKELEEKYEHLNLKIA